MMQGKGHLLPNAQECPKRPMPAMVHLSASGAKCAQSYGEDDGSIGKPRQKCHKSQLACLWCDKDVHSEVPEKIIMERSDHKSVEGVRQYERTSAL